jgi:hypothetical protein
MRPDSNLMRPLCGVAPYEPFARCGPVSFPLVGGGSCQARPRACLVRRVCGPGWIYEAFTVSRQWMALAPTLTYATS